MRECVECGKITENPKFCSLSCSAKFQPRLTTKPDSRSCLQCGQNFLPRRESDPNKFCGSSCAAKYNNKRRALESESSPKKRCLRCAGTVTNQSSKFCSGSCSSDYRAEQRISKWLETGILNAKSIGSRDKIRKYILEDQNGHCALCPQLPFWQDKDLVFVLDHVDGNSEDNRRSNLRLVCPNCNSQLDTFTSKNKGHGRHWRRERYAAGKSF